MHASSALFTHGNRSRPSFIILASAVGCTRPLHRRRTSWMACDSGRCESCRPLRLKAPPTSPAAIYASYPSGLLKLRERRIRRTKRCTFLGLHEAWRSVMATIDTVVGQAGPVSCCQTLSARIELQVMFNSACCAFNYELHSAVSFASHPCENRRYPRRADTTGNVSDSGTAPGPLF